MLESAYVKPGAYVEWRDASRAAVQPLRTDIAGFVGYARRGPIDVPVKVESYRQFEAWFGSFSGAAFLAYAVRAFFENGGRRCWIVRVACKRGGRPASAASVLVAGSGATPRWRISASSPGVWGNFLSLAIVGLTPARTASAGPRDSALYTRVQSVAGFERGDLVKLSAPTMAPIWRVVSCVDPLLRRLYWVHPEPKSALPYDRALPISPDELQIESLAFSLHVRERGRLLEIHSPLSLIPEHRQYGPLVLSERLRAAINAPPSIAIEELGADSDAMLDALSIPAGELTLSGGVDGLSDVTPFDFVGAPFTSADSDWVRATKRRGLRALQDVDEIGIVAAPDVCADPLPEPVFAVEPPEPDPCAPCPAPPQRKPLPQPDPDLPPRFSDEDVFRIQSTLIELCEERRDRFALLDPPLSAIADAAGGPALLREWRTRFETRYAALHYPWLCVVDPLALAPTRRVPPSGHVAGQIAYHDLETGPHRAPANRLVSWAEDTTASVDDATHGELNARGINVLRVDAGRGLRILGARTLSSDPRWRFINVRRLVSMVMKAVDLATQWVVFEPNDEHTRQTVTHALSEFLLGLWQRGALVGPSPAEAFAVRCDETNNPSEARAEGRLLADVAIVPSQPFEVVVIRVGRQGNQFEVREEVRA